MINHPSNDLSNDLSDQLQAQVQNAFDEKTPLRISAGNSKSLYGNAVNAQDIKLATHTGIIEYQPSELVVTVRSGTLLKDLEAELKANKQMLAFEPPQHSDDTTIGGVIACGLSGPRRVANGSARDFVLGTTIINGKAEKCRFGGQVMKNVAGYDASRLMTGAQGTLGILLDISIKVLPASEQEITVKIETDSASAIKNVKQWVKQGLAVSASCYYKNILHVRLSSTAGAVQQSINIINKTYQGEQVDNSFWTSLKNQNHEFFEHNAVASNENNLWRFSYSNAANLFQDTEEKLIEWNGALCWLKNKDTLHNLAAEHQANATRYLLNANQNNGETKTDENIFQPLQPGLIKIQQRLKQAFDPENILNPGRLYSDI